LGSPGPAPGLQNLINTHPLISLAVLLVLLVLLCLIILRWLRKRKEKRLNATHA
jgi:membrane protein DedA with SNARE-associated domain